MNKEKIFMKKFITIFIIVFFYKNAISQIEKFDISKNIYYKFYYKDSTISSEGFLKNGKPDGYWKNYYKSGILKSEGEWKNNVIDSIWFFYSELGDTLKILEYKNGKRNGFQYYYKTDEKDYNYLYLKELYFENKKNGKSIFFYKTGKINVIVPYINNLKNGKEKEFNKNGIIISIKDYKNNILIKDEKINRNGLNNEKIGTWKEFYKNGNVKEEKKYVNGLLNGFAKYYNKNGILDFVILYQNDEIVKDTSNIFSDFVKIKEEYFNNGGIKYRGNFKNERKIGIHRWYDTLGNVIRTIEYDINYNKIFSGIINDNGKKEGNCIYWYNDSITKSKGKFIKGKQNGNWIFYFKNGKIEQKGSYSKAKLNGEWNWFYKNGNIKRKENYLYGNLEGEFIEYDINGNILIKGEYIDGKKENKWYYSVGDHTEKGNYIFNEKDGIWKHFYNNGNLKFEGKFVQGIKTGKQKYYWLNSICQKECYFDNGRKVKIWKKYDELGNLVISIQYKNNEVYKINGKKIDN